MQNVIRFSIVMAIAGMLSFYVPQKEKVNWITIDQLNELYAKNPKPILLDIYTDWCGWCKVMDKNTYNNKKVADYINEHYYAVKLNAESREEFTFNNKKYTYDAKYRSNELALHLLFGRMEFPSTVFLSAIDARPAPLSGYLKPKELEGPLKYFGGGAHASQTFVDFDKKLKREW